MSAYTKSWLGGLVIFGLVVYLWLGVLGSLSQRSDAPFWMELIELFAVVALYSLIWFAYVRLFIKCPNCGIAFGPRMYRPGLIWRPKTHCWNCGADMRAVEAQKKR